VRRANCNCLFLNGTSVDSRGTLAPGGNWHETHSYRAS